MYRSNGFAGSIARAVLEVPSEELTQDSSNRNPGFCPDDVCCQRKKPGSPSPVLEQPSRFLSGCRRFSLPFDLLHVSTTDTNMLALRPTCKTSLLELRRESESNYPYLLATLVASWWYSPVTSWSAPVDLYSPTLERIDKIMSTSGTTVIVGMVSIGSALGVALVAAGCN